MTVVERPQQFAQRLVGHRGYPARYPENTLTGLQAALALGAGYVEVDIQLTRDGVPVLFHDRELSRLCQREGAIHDYDWCEVREFRVHTAAGALVVSQAPLTALSDLVALIPTAPQARFFIELKRLSLEQFGQAAVLSAVLPHLESVADQVTVISYDLPVLQQVREQTGWSIGAVIDEWAARTEAPVTVLQPDYLFCNHESFPADGELGLANMQLVAFETVDPARARQLLARGVDLVETFAIGELRTELEQSSA